MIKCTKETIDRCSFEFWYPLFSSVSIKAKIIPLPSAVIDYLNSDNLVLPMEQRATCMQYDAEDALSEYSDPDSVEAELPSFPALFSQINECINDLGPIFPKLNWSSPKDASWISLDSTLKCNTANDIFLLLKASDFISHDLNYPYEYANVSSHPDQYYLVLKKWCDLFPSMEFRCFVRNQCIIGICQRDTSNYYDFLHEYKDEFLQRIMDFYDSKVKETFPDSNCK